MMYRPVPCLIFSQDIQRQLGHLDDSEWAAGTKHTFAFYYLERGGTLSDCAIKFNLPVFKEFSVTKTVEGKETDQKFDMVLELFEANGDPYKGSLYQVKDGTKTSIQTEEGTYSFSLKDKQTISFRVPQECMSYSVTEKIPEGCSVSWKSSDGLSGEGNATDKVSSTANTEIINQYAAPPTATPVPTEKPRPTGQAAANTGHYGNTADLCYTRACTSGNNSGSDSDSKAGKDTNSYTCFRRKRANGYTGSWTRWKLI